MRNIRFPHFLVLTLTLGISYTSPPTETPFLSCPIICYGLYSYTLDLVDNTTPFPTHDARPCNRDLSLCSYTKTKWKVSFLVCLSCAFLTKNRFLKHPVSLCLMQRRTVYIREFKITTTATATGTSLTKRFNKQNNGCARVL